MTAPHPSELKLTRTTPVCRMVPWAHAGALQRLRSSTLFTPDWIMVVPDHLGRPAIIPRSASAHPMADHETAYIWRDEDRA